MKNGRVWTTIVAKHDFGMKYGWQLWFMWLYSCLFQQILSRSGRPNALSFRMAVKHEIFGTEVLFLSDFLAKYPLEWPVQSKHLWFVELGGANCTPPIIANKLWWHAVRLLAVRQAATQRSLEWNQGCGTGQVHCNYGRVSCNKGNYSNKCTLLLAYWQLNVIALCELAIIAIQHHVLLPFSTIQNLQLYNLNRFLGSKWGVNPSIRIGKSWWTIRVSRSAFSSRSQHGLRMCAAALSYRGGALFEAFLKIKMEL